MLEFLFIQTVVCCNISFSHEFYIKSDCKKVTLVTFFQVRVLSTWFLDGGYANDVNLDKQQLRGIDRTATMWPVQSTLWTMSSSATQFYIHSKLSIKTANYVGQLFFIKPVKSYIQICLLLVKHQKHQIIKYSQSSKIKFQSAKIQ